MASIYECRTELRSIVNELRSLEWEVRQSAIGLGQDICADRIGGLASKYEGLLTRLNRVDVNKLAEWVYGDE